MVDITNYNDKGSVATNAASLRVRAIPQSEALHAVERFTRIDETRSTTRCRSMTPRSFRPREGIDDPEQEPDYQMFIRVSRGQSGDVEHPQCRTRERQGCRQDPVTLATWQKGGSFHAQLDKRRQIAIVASAVTAIVVSQMNRNPVAGQTPDTKLACKDGKPNSETVSGRRLERRIGICRIIWPDRARCSSCAVGAAPAGHRGRRRERDPAQPGGGQEERELDNWVTRPGGQVLHAWGPARDLPAVSFSIVQTAGNVLMAHEYASASRIIKIGKVDPAPVDTWMGQSAGSWEAIRSWST